MKAVLNGSKVKARIATSSLLVVTILLGFLSKYYPGPGRSWVNNNCAGLFYVVFWVLAVFLFMPRRGLELKIPVCVLGLTCMMEFLQLCHPPLLERIRSTFLGSALIGTTFDWSDIPYYLIGAMLGWFFLKIIVDTTLPR